MCLFTELEDGRIIDVEDIGLIKPIIGRPQVAGRQQPYEVYFKSLRKSWNGASPSLSIEVTNSDVELIEIAMRKKGLCH